MEVKWGLVPDMSINQTLPRLVGIDVAKELTFTARTFSGEEALGLGVVTRLAEDPLAAAHELAGEIASRSPDAVRGAKRLFEESWSRPAQETLALEAALQLQLIGSPNQLAAVTAGVMKEPAEFSDPAPTAGSDGAGLEQDSGRTAPSEDSVGTGLENAMGRVYPPDGV